MKIRESGMPEVASWESLFDVPLVLDRMGIDGSVETLVEFGCGYGTFTIPAAGRIKGKLVAFDIEKRFIDFVQSRLASLPYQNVELILGDFVAMERPLARESVDYIMLFNILHHQDNRHLIQQALELLKVGGRMGIIHWRSDINTPRGPSLAIRPTPQSIVQELIQAQATVLEDSIALPPYHFGVLAAK